MPVVVLDLEDDDEEHTAAPQEEFGVLEPSKDEELEKLKEKKVSRGVTVTLYTVLNDSSLDTYFVFVSQYNLLNKVCCSLVNKNCTPGQTDWDDEMSIWIAMKNIAEEITSSDPEFLLKVCVLSHMSMFVLYCLTYSLSHIAFRLLSIPGRN